MATGSGVPAALKAPGVTAAYPGRVRKWWRRVLGTPGAADIERRFGSLVPEPPEPDSAEPVAALTSAAIRDALPDDLAADADLTTYLRLMRELADSSVGLRPFDVQLLATAAMVRGVSVEMATGEGKTLVGALVAVAWARGGQRVHVLAVNDYLAARDAAWMGPLYEAAGVSVAAVTSQLDPDERRSAYASDVVYVPVSEAGFDVLRDRLCTSAEDRVQSPAHAVIVDEADAVLIDEATVPLVLAAGDPQDSGTSAAMTELIAAMRAGTDFEADSDRRTVHLTESGIARIERRFPDADLFGADAELLTQAQVALHARALLTKDVDYVVRAGQVHIVNQARGRLASLQRWPEGLQAAVEAKEGLTKTETAVVLDQILVSDLVTSYDQVVAMSGTLVAVAPELLEFYGLEVGAVPPNRPNIRVDEPDQVFETMTERDEAAIAEIEAAHTVGRPVLVATQSVAESERFAAEVAAADLDALLLNARTDADEAAIVAAAGQGGRITVSTQMAGRGTDIRLDAAATEAGGLLVVGLGRFGSQRLDDQLRGRAGRQGDPGGSVFFTSLEDELVQQYNPPLVPPPPRKWEAHVAAAQRISEAAAADLFRLTRKYTTELTAQRAAVLAARERVLASDPGIERSAQLLAIDDVWCEHLAFALELRDGIHLQALAREQPVTVFTKQVVTAFADLEAQVRDKTDEYLLAGLDESALEARRPAATWTYMVTDQHFGSAWERLGAKLFKGSPREH